jgi:integrase
MMRRYRAALTAAGLDSAFRFHDLRHTFGTSMARAGEPVTTIQAWLGHGDLKTTQRYMHYARRPLTRPNASSARSPSRRTTVSRHGRRERWAAVMRRSVVAASRYRRL